MIQQDKFNGPSVGFGTAVLLVTFALIYTTQHQRFKTEKQKAYILSTISSGVMSALSLWFVWTWIKGSDVGVGRFSFERVVAEQSDQVARYGTILFRSYLIGMSCFCFASLRGVVLMMTLDSADVSLEDCVVLLQDLTWDMV